MPLFDIAHRAKAKGSAADALRATVEAEQAHRQNEVQIAMLSGNIRELDAMAEVSSLKQQIAAEQLKSVQSQLQYGNGDNGRQQLSPKAEQSARIDERQKMIDALDAGFRPEQSQVGPAARWAIWTTGCELTPAEQSPKETVLKGQPVN